MFHQFDQAIDKLPLAGKHTIEPMTKSYIRSASKHELAKFAGITTFLGIFAVLHVMQAKLGVDAFTDHLRIFEATASSEDQPLLALDAGYAAINVAVGLRQLRLIPRLNSLRQHRKKHRQQNKPIIQPETLSETALQQVVHADTQEVEVVPPTPSNSSRQRRGPGFALALTLSGQLAFLASYVNAQNENAQLNCIQRADTQIAETMRTDPADGSYEQRMWADICAVSPTSLVTVTSTR